MCYRIKFRRCMSSRFGVGRVPKISGDADPSRLALQGHSRSLEPTPILFTFPIAIISLFRTVFEVNGDICIKKNSHPCTFNAPLRSCPWNFVTAVGLIQSVSVLMQIFNSVAVEGILLAHPNF